MSCVIIQLIQFSGVFLHDPVSFVALIRPDFFAFKEGVVRVETQGICVGHTLLDQGLKRLVTELPGKKKTCLYVFSVRHVTQLGNAFYHEIAVSFLSCLPKRN